MIELVQGEREEALNIVQVLFSYGFREAITWHKDNGYYSTDFGEWKRQHSDVVKELGLLMDAGETKVCIIYNSKRWVIKIGFQCAGHIDFCRLEENHYMKACDNNLEDYFATTEFIGKVEEIPIYLQERVSVIEDRVSDRVYSYVSSQYPKEDFPDEEERDVEIASAVEYCEDEDIVRAVLAGADDIEELVEFLYEQDINDLHSGNWGATSDGRMVMIDFSGYSWERSVA